MTGEQEPQSLLERLRRNAEAQGLNVPAPEPEMPEFDPALIPDPGPAAPRSSEELELDGVIEGIDILTAYQKWCGKMEPKVGSKRESIMISCPNPAHPDKNPSAWINLDKGTWVCGGCGFEGGDKFDIAAWHFGYPVPGYKERDFPELRRRMAEDFGHVVVRTPSGQDVVATEVPDEELAPVVELPRARDEEAEYLKKTDGLEIDWQSTVRMDTFLYDWMLATTQYDLPDEYFFWLGMQAIAAAIGDDVVLQDVPNVEANLYVCLYGPSGIGKSRAGGMLKALLRQALPYDHDDPMSKGCNIVPPAGSGEALADQFSKKEMDPADPTKLLGYRQVRALVSYDELAGLVARGQRAGSTLKSTVMELYDGHLAGTHSRGQGAVIVENPFCQVLATTQPKAIRDLLVQSDADSGFINRWVFAAGKPKKLIPYGRKPFDVTGLAKKLQLIRSFAGMSREYWLEGEALDEWVHFFETRIEPLKTEAEGDPMLGRLDLTLMKCMVLFAANEHASQIKVEHVQAAIGLFPYLLQTYKMLATEVGIGQVDDTANAILKAVEDFEETFGRPPTMNDLYQRYLRRKFARENIKKALELLVALGELEEQVVKPKVGRPTVRYHATESV